MWAVMLPPYISHSWAGTPTASAPSQMLAAASGMFRKKYRSFLFGSRFQGSL